MKILQLELLTDDINETEWFYTNVIGLRMICKDRSGIAFATGTTKLVFKVSKHVKPIYHFAFNIPKNKLLEAFDWIERNTKVLEVIPPDKIADFYTWNAKSFYFYDSNGNVLEFIARFDLDNASDKSFDGTAVLSISEIGFVTKNVFQLCEELVEKYELPVFSKQPKMEKFIVLGTDTGLFVLVKENKFWYPTNKKAKPFWTKVLFEVKGKIREIEISG